MNRHKQYLLSHKPMVKPFWHWLIRLIQPLLSPFLKQKPHRRVKPQRLLNHQDKLTINDIRQLSLKSYQLVSLAACETALTGRETIEKDYVGLVSAFVYQGVSHVLSALWTIPDNMNSLLFIIYFYWQLKKGKPPAVALAKTQTWLKNLTYQKLRRYDQVIFKQLPEEENTLRPKIRGELGKIREIEPDKHQEKPYKHPYYWAAFTITGAPPDNQQSP